jgi:hypothetical protein
MPDLHFHSMLAMWALVGAFVLTKTILDMDDPHRDPTFWTGRDSWAY